MKAFIHTLLGHHPHKQTSESGIFGLVKGYYGCIEAQGRGTLHCHMLVWLEGGLNLDEIKQHVLQDESFKTQILNFMEDSISTSIPDDPPNVNSASFYPSYMVHSRYELRAECTVFIIRMSKRPSLSGRTMSAPYSQRNLL